MALAACLSPSARSPSNPGASTALGRRSHLVSTRRDVLVSFLGLAALPACKRAPAPIPTTLVDSFLERGHRLRGPPLPRRTVDDARVDVAIVGAGVAGLSAVWRLAGAGVRATVFELDDVVGGTARSGQNAVSRFPWGAHYLPAPLSAVGPVPRLLRELGVLTGVGDDGRPAYDEASLIHDPDERLFYRGRWYEGLYLRAGASEDDLTQLARFERQTAALARAVDGKGRKAFAVPIELGSDDAEFTQLDRLTMAQWLEREGYTSPRLRWLVDYACRDDYGATAEGVSAWAGLWYFTARTTGDERSEGYLSWPEGNGKLVAQLAKSLEPSALRRGTVVHTVAKADAGGWHVHAVDVAGVPSRTWARQVVVAAPRFVACKLVESWRAAPPSFGQAFTQGPWVVANLTLSALPRSRGFPLAWDNVLYGSQSLGYVVATHQRLRGHATGPTVLTWYYPLVGADVRAERERLLGTTADDWRDLVLADLRPAHQGFERLVEKMEVLRWGHAMVRPVPGFLWGPDRLAAQAAVDGSLHFAHADLGGLALFEEANWHGVRAAEDVLSALGNPSPSWLRQQLG